MVRLVWMPSADRHGISHDDAIWAMSDGRRWFVPKFERSRIDGLADPSLFVGWALDGETLLEVMVTPRDETETLVVYHLMEARPRIVDLARRRGVARKEQQQ
jgi:hypothetical protein